MGSLGFVAVAMFVTTGLVGGGLFAALLLVGLASVPDRQPPTPAVKPGPNPGPEHPNGLE